MNAHVIRDDTVTMADADPSTDVEWLRLSAAVTEEVSIIADREDLVVTVLPGAGRGSPACFLPPHAAIEVDGTHLDGIDPATAVPDRTSDRARYPTMWGLLTHECAHARHTTWQPPADAPAGAVAAALLLEESRIEAAQVRRRPDDRHWLRASATDLILADTQASDPAHAPEMSPSGAAQAAALLLARVDAGILTTAETEAVARIIESVLGADILATLTEIWRTAHRVADDDAETMLELGRRWCATLGADPDEAATDHSTASSSGSSSSTDGQPDSSVPEVPQPAPAPSPLAGAIVKAATDVRAAVACEPAPADPADTKAAADATEHAAQRTASSAARKTFAPNSTGARRGSTAIAGTRPALSSERVAARRLGKALSTAGVRDHVTTRTTSLLPPGRLRMRGALAADAQRAAGALPTAEPFTRTTRRAVPTPPLRLGVACDVSGSMHAYTDGVASAAWILAHAAHHARMPATTATVIFGHRVRAITHPGSVPVEVTEFDATDSWEDIATAIDALDGALDLSRRDAARLLVIISDGRYRPDARRDGQTRVRRLRATGCGVLWLAPDHHGVVPLDGVTVHTLADPATTAEAIGHAATAALRTTR